DRARAAGLPRLFDERVAASDGVVGPVEHRRLLRATDNAKIAVELYGRWLEASLPGGTDAWATGRERADALVAHRAFDGLDADAILALGQEQLARETEARAEAAR